MQEKGAPMNPRKLKPLLKFLLPAAVVLLSIKPAIFTWDLMMANYHIRNDNGGSAGHMYNTLRTRPTVYRVYKKYKHSRIDDVIAKRAVYSKYNENINIFDTFNAHAEELALSRFETRFKDNFYFRYLFASGDIDYGSIDGNWQNLDGVSLDLLADPRMNALTLSLWEKMKWPAALDDTFTANLADYCRWKGNTALSDHLEKTAGKTARKTESKPIDPSVLQGHNPRASLRRLGEILFEKNKLTAGDFEANRLKNGDFEDSNGEFEKHWYLTKMASRVPFGDGSFTMGLDTAGENRYLRIMGLYAGNVKGKQNVRGGAWAREKIPIKKGFYIFCFDYLTKTGNEKPTVYLWKGIDELDLPGTGGKWKKAVYFLNNVSGEHTVLKPFFRMWGTGTVLIDNIYLARITHPRFVFHVPGILYVEEWK